MDPENFFRKFVALLQGLRPERDYAALTPTTHLWEHAYLDSFMLVQIIVFLEDLVGREIQLSADALPTFYTAASIYENYVAPRGAP